MSAVAIGGGAMTYAVGIPSSPCSGIAGSTRNFTIIASDTGYNGSADHMGQAWPVMNVNRCDIVKITIINTVTQTHGFAIDYYGVKGTEIPGQQTILFPAFQAVKAGNFRVYCTVRCTIHPAMLNGRLNVS
jgi:hypothetical protein